MTINLNGGSQQLARQFAKAFASGDQTQVEDAFRAFSAAASADLAEQFRSARAEADRAALAQRGFRQLTSAEQRYYEGVIDALKSPQPMQAFADFSKLPDGVMPSTVIDEVMKDLAEKHPLLSMVQVVNTGYMTKWLRNKHARQLAVWGAVTGEITKEITSAFEEVDFSQGKLSCFAMVSMDMLELGPTFLDGYVRAVVGEAMSCGLEHGIVNGTGIKGEPVGLTRTIASGTSVNDSTGYPAKTAVKVTDFGPASYGALVAKLVRNEQGKTKEVDVSNPGLALLCSPVDYLTKVMPATTVQAVDGTYKRDLLPVPTEVAATAELTDGTAVLFLKGEYTLFVGGNRGIQYDDSCKFLEDCRTFKDVTYAFGRAFDDTSAVVLDISKLDPAYVTVKTKVDGTVSTKASA